MNSHRSEACCGVVTTRVWCSRALCLLSVFRDRRHCGGRVTDCCAVAGSPFPALEGDSPKVSPHRFTNKPHGEKKALLTGVSDPQEREHRVVDKLRLSWRELGLRTCCLQPNLEFQSREAATFCNWTSLRL